MKKKKVKDEDGYLGRHMCAHFYSHADHIQSPRKKLYGSLSRRTNLNPRGLNLRPPGRQAVRRESRLVRKDKAVLPVSSRKLDTSKARCCVHTLNTHLALKPLQVSIFPPSIAPRPHIVHFESERSGGWCLPLELWSNPKEECSTVTTGDTSLTIRAHQRPPACTKNASHYWGRLTSPSVR
jgi:hypothetical protein